MNKEIKLFIISFGVLLLLSTGAILALASTGFVFSSQSPAPGSTIKIMNPTISTVVTADANINSGTVTMFVDGHQVVHTFKYYYNAWTRKYDYKRGTIAYNATGLTAGSHQVLVQATDVYGNTGQTSWEFAVAGPPVISGFNPANNSKSGDVREISAVAKAVGSEINPQSIIVKINNVAVPGDGVAYDAATGKISVAYPDGLTGGNYNVYIEVADSLGYKGTATWSFAVISQPPQFSVVSPVAGSIVATSNPKIELKIQAISNINSDTVKLLVNGQFAAAKFFYNYDSYSKKYDYTKGTLTYQPAVLPNGTHAISAEATDITGNRGEISWNFSVKAPPKIMGISPNPNTTVADKRPVISVDLYSSEELSRESIIFSAQGSKIDPVLTNLGEGIVRWSYQPAAEWQFDETVQFEFLATNPDGLTAQRQWYYVISPYSEMSAGIASCTLCHDSENIKRGLCGSCHTYDIPTWQYRCFDCHLTGTPPKQHHMYSTYTHNTTEDHTVAKEQFASCSSCHSSVLTREHNQNDFTCSTCHSHESSVIQKAITDGNRNCLACHTGEAASLVHPDHNVSYGVKCIECHGSNMMEEKVRHNNDCASCHSSTDSITQGAIQYQKSSCFDCHSTPHGITMIALPKDITLLNNVIWSTPQSAEIFAGEEWLPPEFENNMSRILLSSRTQVKPDDVYSYYKNEMGKHEWVVLEDSRNSYGFKLVYRKDRRYCVIFCYSGDIPGSEDNNPAGVRLMIAYH